MTAGLTSWIELQKYVPLLIFFAIGLGAVGGGHYRLLKRLFETPVRLGSEEAAAVNSLTPVAAFDTYLPPEIWNLLTVPRGSIVPVSRRVFELLAIETPDLAGDRTDFERLFDSFEILASLSYVHQRIPLNEDPRVTSPWFPPGRWIRWRRDFVLAKASPLNAWFDEAEAARDAWPPLMAGMFGGDYDRFLKLRLAFENWFNRVVL
jgi:hypothetical protein